MITLASSVTIADGLIFLVAGVIVLTGAIGIITVKNPVHAALSLVMTLFGIAVLFIEQQADFLAAVQVIVYAGAIVVLFLFVIMFLGVDRKEDLKTEPLVAQRPLAVILVTALMAGIVALGATSKWSVGAHSVTGALHGAGGNVKDLGTAVFTTYLFAFEGTAALLIIAVIGAVVLARKQGSTELDEDAILVATPSDEPSIESGGVSQ